MEFANQRRRNNLEEYNPKQQHLTTAAASNTIRKAFAITAGTTGGCGEPLYAILPFKMWFSTHSQN